MDKVDLKSMTLPKLEAYCASIGLPKFRAGQIFQWLHEKQVDSFDEMTNLSADLREKLKENCFISGIPSGASWFRRSTGPPNICSSSPTAKRWKAF